MSEINTGAPTTAPAASSSGESAGASQPQRSSGFQATGVESSSTETASNSQGQETATATPAQKQVERLLKLKIDGQEMELSEADVIKRAQLGSSATKRFEEAKAERAKIAQLKEVFKKNPIQALLDPALGLTKDEIRDQFENWYKAEYINPSRMTPEQRELAELKAYKQQQEEAQQLTAKQAEQQKHDAERKQWSSHWQKQIVESMQKLDIPNSDYAVGLVAQKLKLAKEAGVDVPVEHVATMVKDDLSKVSKHIMGKMSGEQLISFLGDDLIKLVRKADLARLRAGQPSTAAPQQPQILGEAKPLRQTNNVVGFDKVKNYFDSLND